MRRFVSIVLASLGLSASVPASTAITYNFMTEGFIGGSQLLDAAAVYVSPGFISVPTIIPLAGLTDCAAKFNPPPGSTPCVSLTLTPSASGDMVTLKWVGGESTGDFAAGALSAVGLYLDNTTSSSLLVSGTPDPGPSPIPEPSSWALLVGGFAFSGIALRRSQRRGAHALA